MLTYTVSALLTVVTLHLLFHHKRETIRSLLPSTPIPEYAASTSDFGFSEKLVIFPQSFPRVNLTEYYNQNFNGNAHQKIFRHVASPPRCETDELEFHQYPINVFHSAAEPFEDKEECPRKLQEDFNVNVGRVRSLHAPLDTIVQRLAKSQDPYIQDISAMFKGEIGFQLEEKTVQDHWYRFAGSSLWLEEYGVHFVISRIIYSPTGQRNKPTLSLSYAQIYNEKWQEMLDVELIVPSNNMSFDSHYANVTYPTFLSIPTYHDASQTEQRYYGPEDPRLILVKNAEGHEEPVMIFNTYHRKILDQTQLDSGKIDVKFGHYRSMFMAWPWQFQKGKANAEGIPNEESDHLLHTRIVELRKKDVQRTETEKNWTPFISYQDRKEHDHDKYMYFVISMKDLEILKCELSGISGSESVCEYIYRTDDKLPLDHKVGSLRGGTQLINVNLLLEQEAAKGLPVDFSHLNVTAGREIWVGFARAHLVGCGCNDFYRPNFVVITKENGKYKISHLSSFVSFDVPVFGWDSNHPYDMCGRGASAFIPNGISMWKTISSSSRPHEFMDSVTMSFSLVDNSVETVEVRGLLKGLLEMKTNPTNMPEKLGYNNNNIECALDRSWKFCGDFGKMADAMKTKKLV